MPRQNTRPEVDLRRALHAKGLRFRIHMELPGHPDIGFTRAKLAVFVDGCFWHGCPDHGTLPKNNREWWGEKLRANIERDKRKDADLRTLGWLAIHVWEHERVETAADRIHALWLQRRDGPSA